MSRALGRLRALRDGPATALVVPVPEAERLVPAVDGMPPHVTVLYPFAGARAVDAEALRALFAAHPAFAFALAAVGRFPGVLHLRPEPAAPFVSLTEAVAARWPAHPPYGGAYAEVIPHLTLVEGREPPGLADRAAAALPIHARADAVWLMAPRRDGRWERRAAFPLAN